MKMMIAHTGKKDMLRNPSARSISLAHDHHPGPPTMKKNAAHAPDPLHGVVVHVQKPPEMEHDLEHVMNNP